MRETPRATRSASPPRPSTPATPCPSPRRAAASAPHHAWTSPTSGRAPSPTRPSCASSRTLLLGLGSRKSVSKEIEGRRIPLLPDAVWSADFMADALACGRRFRTFNVVDDFNREALHIEVDTSISSTRLVRIFEQLKRDHGLPQVLRTDNGPEFLGEAFVQWAKLNGMAIRYIQPGKPNQNAYIERFNRTFREEVLDQHLFTRLDDVREAAYWWMLEYNEERPHDSLGDLTPAEYRQRVAGSSTFEMPA